jgi:hypothetical protein
MRLLYLYPEEWTGRRAREVHTLSTCVALARSGMAVTLVTAGGQPELQAHLCDVAGREVEPELELIALSRAFGPVRSSAIFSRHFEGWLLRQKRFDAAYVIHLKAAALLTRARIPFLYEAHEIFSETPQKDPARQERLSALEGTVLAEATWRVATSRPLALALRERYPSLPNDFVIVPNAGSPPLAQSTADADGPFIYCGSLGDWKGLDTVIDASRDANVPLKIVGGTADEWRALSERGATSHITWQPRVPLADLPQALAGACAGLIPTRSDTPSGRYSCPMKLFDYARCGLPVLSTSLPALQSLDVGSWCTQVEPATRESWAEAMRQFRFREVQAETARAWAGVHTWNDRAAALVRLLFAKKLAR